jgi:putative two-component system response regulator
MIPFDEIRKARILVVDDQESNLLLLQKVLGAAGYESLLTVADPTQVPDLYRAFKPDLMLLDLHMPGLDGFEVMALLRAAVRDDYLPILVLTADVTHPTRLRALEMGARDFLTKPFDQVEVVTRIRNMLEVRLLHNRLRDQNAVLEQKVRERTQELVETRLEIIHRLGRAAEYRDKGTGLHILRISHISAALGRAAGLPNEQREIIMSASPMHDIGKIGIPDSILLKQGKLDGEEWEVMKTHTTIGAELLAGHDSILMSAAASIALTHHERWDGNGYPRGLQAEAIPMEGRIVALADVFDALLSERPYKKAWPMDAALQEIDALAGKAFDPVLVEALHRGLPEIREIVRSIEAKVLTQYKL